MYVCMYVFACACVCVFVYMFLPDMVTIVLNRISWYPGARQYSLAAWPGSHRIPPVFIFLVLGWQGHTTTPGFSHECWRPNWNPCDWAWRILLQPLDRGFCFGLFLCIKRKQIPLSLRNPWLLGAYNSSSRDVNSCEFLWNFFHIPEIS